MTGSVLLVLAAVGMLAFGRWGQRQATALASTTTSAERRARKERQVRRGGIAWQVAAIVVLVGAIVRAMHEA